MVAATSHCYMSTWQGTIWWVGHGNPGAGRRPVPGTQEQFGAIVQAWIDTGAACP
jgi:hypothetical protein